MTSEKMSKSQNYGRYSYTTDVWKAISGKTVLYMLLAAVSVALKMGFAFLVSEIVDGAINFEMTRPQRLFFFSDPLSGCEICDKPSVQQSKLCDHRAGSFLFEGETCAAFFAPSVTFGTEV
ncbi:MAG: hypothetical protein ACLRPV_11895 [Lacrimispora saccharolytica]